MKVVSKGPSALIMTAMLAASVAGGVSAQEATSQEGEVLTTVYGSPPADLEGMAEGPAVEGMITARSGNKVQVTSADGTSTVFLLSEGTKIRSSGGFLGLSKDKLTASALLNGLPVEVDTVRWANGLVATDIALKSKDLKTAAMISNGTNQRFVANETAINANAAATEALRGRMGDIDKYNIKGTTNVYFDTGKWNLQGSAESELCAAAAEAESMDNALLLVVGYTDSVGDEDYNQVLSERRAGKVVNYLQQKCGWKPWRMLTPTGMAESDPLADNSTAEGRRQNRRVSVNILVSKAVDEG
ncbi:Outer membrane protein A precursor [Altererythrobacter epoxidivorans]|uniref:Outer membrane protein A n=1 Tax=Altererythrobacter epoxidivorans TaxID=361183 RepID=A0A0M4M9D5_9SPHN|nr:OmpA family protein [Altererythrobacter epoxidivorans]ALE17427.1 Outer membrane protein A precursor [Altererythrobacter epoxidivorans]